VAIREGLPNTQLRNRRNFSIIVTSSLSSPTGSTQNTNRVGRVEVGRESVPKPDACALDVSLYPAPKPRDRHCASTFCTKALLLSL
jgi:hypothetical protein